jgi:hypothetical protein
MFIRYLFYAFLIYLAYRLVFDLIIPVYKTTRQVKKQFREMQSHMENYANRQSSFSGSAEDNLAPHTNSSAQKKHAGDYIDFEEVK